MPRKIGDLKLFSVDDLHEMLGISKMTIRAYLREGKLKGRKLGVKWFITEDSLRTY
ncbi:MAG: helix-turn-helix domain-containing protein, partial [Balneolaceae bacterium]